jgi:hypothetical protein
MDSSLFRLRSRELARASQRPRATDEVHVDVEAVVDGTTPSDRTIVAPPHSRLRFVESKTTEEQPARPAGRRPSTRRLRFTKI